MADVAADVPGKYDIIIDGHGYIFANTIEQSLPFRTQRADYSFSQQFVSRQNVGAGYGDNQQDFWFTAAQKDWSLGEDQKFFRIGDSDKERSYWLGQNVDISTPGQVTLNSATSAITFAANVVAACRDYSHTYVITSAKLYSVDSTGAIIDLGAHGVAGPAGIISDGGGYLLIWSGLAVRKYNTITPAFSDYTANGFDHATFSNNTFYGMSFSTFSKVDTAGTKTDIYVFKDVTGSTAASYGIGSLVAPYGGKVLIARADADSTDLYEGDAGGVDQLASLPSSFFLTQMTVSRGIVFMVGTNSRANKGSRTEVYYYLNGNLNLLWHGQYYSGTFGRIGVAEYLTGIVWNDPGQSRWVFYDLATGATSTIASFTATGADIYISAAYDRLVTVQSGATGGTLFYATTTATTGYVETSLIDFESSLPKYAKAIVVDFTPGTDGNGGSVDIAYQLDSLDGSYTSLATGVSSGVETAVNQTCHSISVKVTLNKGTSTSGPTLKRVYVRAVPIEQTFRNDTLIIDCTGRDGKTPVILRNQNPHPLDGQAQVTNLRTAITATTPVTVTDRFGTFTAVIDASNTDIIEWRPEEYLVRIALRQV